MAATLGALTGYLFFAALIISVGTVATRWLILTRLPEDSKSEADFAHASTAGMGFVTASLLPVGMVALFARQLVQFHDPFATWGEDTRLLLTGTAWGATWAWGMAGALLAPVGFGLASRGTSAGWWIATAALLGVGSFVALTGHAAGTEELRSVTLTADLLHVLAAGGWVGGLAAILWVDRAWRQRPDTRDGLLQVLVPAFSPVALASVSVMILTGVLASWIHLDDVGALFSNRYGRTLLLKLSFVSAAMALGAINWRRHTPSLKVGAEQPLRRSAMAELVLFQVVLLITAFLVQTAPIGH